MSRKGKQVRLLIGRTFLKAPLTEFVVLTVRQR